MIKGLSFAVEGTELRQHLLDRAVHHEQRAAWYEQQKEQLADTPVSLASNDPVAALKESGKRHVKRATLFRFYAAHVRTTESYDLSTHELGQIEMIDDPGY